MAPSKASQRRSQHPSELLYTLGERGRKTGVTLRDTGARDEHGMQPLDDIFSSPAKDDGSDSGEADMDLTTASGPGPASLINGQNGNRLPLPRSRSPVKTYLKSPAVRNPNLGPTSSPLRGTVITSPKSNRGQSVKRKLDFSLDSTSALKPAPNGLRAKASKVNGVNGLTNGYHSSSEEEQEDEEAILHGQLEGEDSMQMVDDGGGYDEPEGEEEEEQQEEDEEEVVEEETVSKAAALPKKRAGRPPKTKTVAPKEPARSPKRGRPARESSGVEDAAEGSEEPPTKRQRNEAKAKGRKPAKAADTPPQEEQPAKKRGRKRKSDGAQEASVLIQRAPPLPKGRGLVINRSASTTTRSGRTSIQPLQFWKNERVEYDRDDVFENAVDGRKKHDRFVLPAIKEIVRVEDEEVPSRPRSRKAPGKRPKRRASSEDEEDEEDLEPWEREEGDIEGDIVVWHPEHEFAPPGSDDEIEAAREQIALAGGAIDTKEVRGATFGFAKTLSMPFFGSGVVDLPPGSEKRPKNSRKMHMTFFVFSGRVQVSVANTEFRISKGGMWFVPRGNYYSIVNDYDKPARIFFAQGCEVVTSIEPAEEE